MRFRIIILALLVVGTGCAPPTVDVGHQNEPTAEVLQTLLRSGKFDEAKRLIDQKRETDPLFHWAHRLAEADEMWDSGKREECLREYEAFFRFYEELETRSRDRGDGQHQNPELSPAAVAPDEA